MDSVEHEYDYRPKWTMIVLGGGLFGLGAAVFGAKGDWVWAAISAGFVVLAAFHAYHRATFQQRLVFGSAAMTVPASFWSREVIKIAYRDIVALSMATIRGQGFLYVTHPAGKYQIIASWLPSNAVFKAICELLATKVREAQAVKSRQAEPGAAADGGA